MYDHLIIIYLLMHECANGKRKNQREFTVFGTKNGEHDVYERTISDANNPNGMRKILKTRMNRREKKTDH